MAWKKTERCWYQSGHFLSTVITSLLFRPKIIGKEHLPKKGSVLIAPNHRSFLDIPVLGCATWRPLRFMAKKDLFKNKFVKWYFETNGSFSVDKGNSDPVAVKKAVGILKDGDALVVFPEGQRKKHETIDELNSGVGFLAAKALVPVVPVAISGIDTAVKRKGIFPVFSRAYVVIGPAITHHIEIEGKTSEKTAVVLAQLHTQLNELYQKSLLL